MAKTNAQRQAEYRQRQAANAERINMLVSPNSTAALKRLAEHYAVTQREILEKLIGKAELSLMDELRSNEPETAEPQHLGRAELPGRCECVTAKGTRCTLPTKGMIQRTIDGKIIDFAACGRHTNWKAEPAHSVVKELAGTV